VARQWPDLEGEMIFMSYGEIARTELKREFGGIKRVGWQPDHVKLFDWRWPMFFKGEWGGEAVYTDISAAYWQLYRCLWLDVAFPRGRGSLDLWPISERLANVKPARNSLIGITRARLAWGYKGNRRITLPTKNEFLSPHLWATIQAALNEIAWQAEKTGAIYCATDGYIHPSKSNWADFQQWLDSKCIKYKWFHSFAKIRGWGNYSIPPKVTQSFTNNAIFGSRQFRSLNVPFPNEPTKIIDWIGEIINERSSRR
jgi:hypothetical protein